MMRCESASDRVQATVRGSEGLLLPLANLVYSTFDDSHPVHDISGAAGLGLRQLPERVPQSLA